MRFRIVGVVWKMWEGVVCGVWWCRLWVVVCFFDGVLWVVVGWGWEEVWRGRGEGWESQIGVRSLCYVEYESSP